MPSKKIEELIITEGVTDAISVIQSGYPCLSPVTVRFRNKDYEPIIQHCRRFKKILVINDNEEPKAGKKYCEGMQGSIDSAKLLYSNGVFEVYIGILPDQYKDVNKKVDINSYLAQFKDNDEKQQIQKQHDALKQIVDGSLHILNFLFQEAKKEYVSYTDSQMQQKATFIETFLKELVSIIPETEISIISAIKEKFKNDFNIGAASFRTLLNKLRTEKKVNAIKKRVQKPVKNKGQEKDLYYDNIWKIVSADDGIWVFEMGKTTEGQEYVKKAQQILYGKFNILSKTLDYRVESKVRFNFIHNGIHQNTRTLDEVISVLGKDLYKGVFGQNVIANYIRKKAENLPFYKGEYLLGFNDGWKLPIMEEKLKISLITQTAYQRRAYNNARKMIKKYTLEEKEEIKKQLKEFVDRTQIEPIQLAIIIGWAMAAPFREEFIEYFKIFPLLLLTGKLSTGKSYIEDFFIVHFYGIWEEHFSPSETESVSRIEDMLSSNTFPIDIQEIHKFAKNVIAILKDQATSRSNFERKKPNQDLAVSKPKSASLAMDANDIPEGLDSPALNTKMIHLNLIRRVKAEGRWKELYSKMVGKKLFSLVYDYSKDWDRKHVQNQLKEIKEIFLSKENRKKFGPYARLQETYIAIMFGLKLFYNVFGINFPFEGLEILKILARERRQSTKSFADAFKFFCISAINFDEGVDGKRGNNPSYLNHKLFQIKDGYGFSPDNKRDFINYMKDNYSMSKIANLVEQNLDNKELIKHQTIYVNGTSCNGIYIHEDFFDNSI